MHPEDNAGRPWPAPAASGPVSARVRLPASKSITNRALVLAALSDGQAVIANPLVARDTVLAVGALRALGAAVTEDDPPAGTSSRVTPGQPDDSTSGTTWRVTPGQPAAGAQVSVHGGGALRGGTVTLDASGSSQLVSGLLLTAPRCDEGVRIRHEGPPVPSAPHIAMTVRMLRAAGADVTELSGSADGRPDGWVVRPGRLELGAITVEPDLSNAGPFLAAALVTGGTVTIPDWPRDSLQAAGQILDVLSAMGASYEFGADGLTITGTGRIEGITADLRDVSELAQVLTAVAAVADSPSVFTGLAHTRSHETDRLAAMAKEINALGGDVTELPDGLAIRPRPLRADAAAGPFGSYNDHRMVMAAAVLGLAVPGIAVANAQTVAKTFPGFTDVWAGMLGPQKLEPVR
jgi:3-phosphoshikimate 1-carboxyvinyltransferase